MRLDTIRRTRIHETPICADEHEVRKRRCRRERAHLSTARRRWIDSRNRKQHRVWSSRAHSYTYVCLYLSLVFSFFFFFGVSSYIIHPTSYIKNTNTITLLPSQPSSSHPQASKSKPPKTAFTQAQATPSARSFPNTVSQAYTRAKSPRSTAKPSATAPTSGHTRN